MAHNTNSKISNTISLKAQQQQAQQRHQHGTRGTSGKPDPAVVGQDALAVSVASAQGEVVAPGARHFGIRRTVAACIRPLARLSGPALAALVVLIGGTIAIAATLGTARVSHCEFGTDKRAHNARQRRADRSDACGACIATHTSAVNVGPVHIARFKRSKCYAHARTALDHAGSDTCPNSATVDKSQRKPNEIALEDPLSHAYRVAQRDTHGDAHRVAQRGTLL